MAITPSAVYSEYVSGSDLTRIVSSVQDAEVTGFLNLCSSAAGTADHYPGTLDEEMFLIKTGDGDTAVGGAGYDVVVETTDTSGNVHDLYLDPTVESGVLQGTDAVDIVGNSLANVLIGNSGENTLY